MKTTIQGKSTAVQVLTAVLFSATWFLHAGEPLSLAGVWRFQLDRDDAGVNARWFERALIQKIQLPGSLSA